MIVHFWPHTQNPNIASYRLRCLRVMEGLINQGIDVRLFRNGDIPEKLVLSKRYDPASIQQALELKKKFGTKLYLDICDNHFYYKTPVPAAMKRANQLRDAVRAVDVVIASSKYLAEVINEETTDLITVVVIGDLVDFPYIPSLTDKLKHPVSYFQFKKLELLLGKRASSYFYKLVWFGNHGGGYADSGMNDLETIRPYLEYINEEAPVHLTIISNSWKKYRTLTKYWHLQTSYLPWNRIFFSSALSQHDVSIIPIQKNPFTMSKTSNRVETSLIHGLRVVADSIPSYVDYKEDVYLGDWIKSLQTLRIIGTSSFLKKNEIDFKNGNIEIVKAWKLLLK
jgi:hypothetical protein